MEISHKFEQNDLTKDCVIHVASQSGQIALVAGNNGMSLYLKFRDTIIISNEADLVYSWTQLIF